MRKNVIALLAGVLLIPLSLTGCGTQKSNTLSDVQRITYVAASGEDAFTEMFVLAPDYAVKHYAIMGNINSFDWSAGELPPDYKYRVTEQQITKENWNKLMEAVDKSRFTDLPEELPDGEIYDGSAYYIQVETADGIYKSGGYEAGRWSDGQNKRFKIIKDELDNIVWNQ